MKFDKNPPKLTKQDWYYFRIGCVVLLMPFVTAWVGLAYSRAVLGG